VQDVATAHWRAAARPDHLAEVLWLLTRHEIDYKKQAFENEEITATTWVGEWSKVTCERFTDIHRGNDLLVKSRTVWCMIDRKTTKPVRIDKSLRSRFI